MFRLNFRPVVKLPSEIVTKVTCVYNYLLGIINQSPGRWRAGGRRRRRAASGRRGEHLQHAPALLTPRQSVRAPRRATAAAARPSFNASSCLCFPNTSRICITGHRRRTLDYLTVTAAVQCPLLDRLTVLLTSILEAVTAVIRL